MNYLGFPDVLALQHVPTGLVGEPDYFNYTLFEEYIEKVVADAPNKYEVIPSADGVPIFYNPWRVSWYEPTIFNSDGMRLATRYSLPHGYADPLGRQAQVPSAAGEV